MVIEKRASDNEPYLFGIKARPGWETNTWPGVYNAAILPSKPIRLADAYLFSYFIYLFK
jgi:hypothetical protein